MLFSSDFQKNIIEFEKYVLKFYEVRKKEWRHWWDLKKVFDKFMTLICEDVRTSGDENYYVFGLAKMTIKRI